MTDKKEAAHLNSKTGYAPVNGLQMYYEIHGDGPALVLIHGGGSTISTTFGRVLPRLAESCQVIAVELQAHGHTSDRDEPERFEQDADDVAVLLNYLQVPKASFFGFSNGGHTAMQIAFRHPGIVERLIVASAFYKKEGTIPGFFEGIEKASLEIMPRMLQEAFLQINPDHNKLLNMFNKDRERMLRFQDWSDELLRSIQALTLILTGDRDVVTPVHAATMAALIPQARLMILPATHGSYMCIDEEGKDNPRMHALTIGLIKEFLLAEQH